uniref:Uncharacterized protein n=1 Tax=Molossus molossus TaxID=27622 RepID=A0A7J8EE97_MOLMO|nr:hypothetical protein HJG59_008857 [Molossus molossus]
MLVMASLHCCNHQFSSLSSSVLNTIARKLMLKSELDYYFPPKNSSMAPHFSGSKNRSPYNGYKVPPFISDLTTYFSDSLHPSYTSLLAIPSQQGSSGIKSLHWLFPLPRMLSISLMSVLVTPSSSNLCLHSQ